MVLWARLSESKGERAAAEAIRARARFVVIMISAAPFGRPCSLGLMCKYTNVVVEVERTHRPVLLTVPTDVADSGFASPRLSGDCALHITRVAIHGDCELAQ